MIPNDVHRALAFIPPDDRETWWRVAAALKRGFGDEALPTFMGWSRQSKAFVERDALATWRSFRGRPRGGITLGSLFAIAKQHGYTPDANAPVVRPPPRDDSAEQAQREREIAEAKRGADVMLRAAKFDYHPYLERKGFPGERGLTYPHPYYGNCLLLPLRTFRSELLCVQAITEAGEKRFLPMGGTSSGGVHLLGGRRGLRWWVEGYATGLSVRAALKRLYRTDDTVVVAFSDYTVRSLARGGIVVADHDHHVCNACPHRWYGQWGDAVCPACGSDRVRQPAGERAARETGLLWWQPPDVKDANDYHVAHGVDALAEVLGGLFRRYTSKVDGN